MAKGKIEVFTLKNGKGDKGDIKLVYPELRKTVLVLRAINHDLRKDMVRLLSEAERMNVTDIYVKLRLEQSVASQHLAILRRAGIVDTERQGKYIYYALNRERLKEIDALVQEIAV